MSKPFTVACVQTSSARDVDVNIKTVGAMIREARARGAEFIMLPETVGMVEPNRELRLKKAVVEEKDKALKAFRALAAELKVWLLIGSLAVRTSGRRLANRSFLVDPKGKVVASYDKIHLFDVDLGTESHRESSTIRPGRKAVVAKTPWGKLGMTVCYDVRFPHLYRRLAKAGAIFLSVPSGFTRPTGSAHWHTLLRARAIENGSFVFAPAQCGEHADGRKTFGHSLIVDPWGEILAEAGDDVGIITARIDPKRVADVRRSIPALTHDRPIG
jgi:predicted amidohydrolase